MGPALTRDGERGRQVKRKREEKRTRDTLVECKDRKREGQTKREVEKM